MEPKTFGQVRCEEIVADFAEPIDPMSSLAISRTDAQVLIQRAIAAFQRRHDTFMGPEHAAKFRRAAADLVSDAFSRGCIPQKKGAAPFAVFAIATCACLMESRQLTWRGMKGVLAAVDDHLLGIWQQPGVTTECPSTRGL